MAEVFETAMNAREHFANLIIRDVTEAIHNRPPGPRDQKYDDQTVFGKLNTAMAMAVSQRDYALAKRVFTPCYIAALEYERNNTGSEIHKGAPTFNMGVTCLRSYDFVAAMQYFELAEEETKRTSGKRDWRIFLNELFDRNYWDTVDAAASHYPIALYEQLWSVRWAKKTIKRNWWRVSSHSKLLLLVNIAQRIRYRQLADQSLFPKSASLSLAYWNLCADLARLLETEVGRRAKPTPTTYKLYEMLTQGFATTKVGNISVEIVKLHALYKVKSTKTFNAAFPMIRAAIENPNFLSLERVSNALYLFYATRNQVQHHVDRRMILYKDVETSIFTADVLLTLCRLDSWTA
jgi:hypothetical protein